MNCEIPAAENRLRILIAKFQILATFQTKCTDLLPPILLSVVECANFIETLYELLLNWKNINEHNEDIRCMVIKLLHILERVSDALVMEGRGLSLSYKTNMEAPKEEVTFASDNIQELVFNAASYCCVDTRPFSCVSQNCRLIFYQWIGATTRNAFASMNSLSRWNIAEHLSDYEM